MYTSLIAWAMAHTLAVKPEAMPTWDTDYRHAKALAAKEQKPMAIVVGNGAAGWDKLVADGNFLAATTAELRAAYVWVYLDLDQESTKKVASTFEFTKGPAVVLSDRGGTVQAYRRVGAVEGQAFRKALTNYSDTELVVRRTEETGNVAPVSYQPQYYNPFQYQQGSCASCRR